MDKILRLPVPVYLKRFYESEYSMSAEMLGDTKFIRVHSNTEIGNLISLVSTYSYEEVSYPKLEAGQVYLSFLYYAKNKSKNILASKLPEMTKQLDKIFRARLCMYVSIHCQAFDGYYYTYIAKFLEQSNIKIDVDISKDTARKIYRDYLEKNYQKSEREMSEKSVMGQG